LRGYFRFDLNKLNHINSILSEVYVQNLNYRGHGKGTPKKL